MEIDLESIEDHIELHDDLDYPDRQLLLKAIEMNNKAAIGLSKLEGNYRVLALLRYYYKNNDVRYKHENPKILYMQTPIEIKEKLGKYNIALLRLTIHHFIRSKRASQIILDLYEKAENNIPFRRR